MLSLGVYSSYLKSELFRREAITADADSRPASASRKCKVIAFSSQTSQVRRYFSLRWEETEVSSLLICLACETRLRGEDVCSTATTPIHCRFHFLITEPLTFSSSVCLCRHERSRLFDFMQTICANETTLSVIYQRDWKCRRNELIIRQVTENTIIMKYCFISPRRYRKV